MITHTWLVHLPLQTSVKILWSKKEMIAEHILRGVWAMSLLFKVNNSGCTAITYTVSTGS